MPAIVIMIAIVVLVTFSAAALVCYSDGITIAVSACSAFCDVVARYIYGFC